MLRAKALRSSYLGRSKSLCSRDSCLSVKKQIASESLRRVFRKTDNKRNILFLKDQFLNTYAHTAKIQGTVPWIIYRFSQG